MTEDHRELHLPEALTHAAVPPPGEPHTAADDVAPAGESDAVPSRLEELFPLAWLGMLTVVCVVGIYSAVTRLP